MHYSRFFGHDCDKYKTYTIYEHIHAILNIF